jgi:hypothetical protein
MICANHDRRQQIFVHATNSVSKTFLFGCRQEPVFISSLYQTPEMATKAPRYLVETAPSGRAYCKACCTYITKGHPRFGILSAPADDSSATYTKWSHVRCVAPKHRRAVAADRRLMLGLESLPPTQQQDVERWLDTGECHDEAAASGFKCAMCTEYLPRGVNATLYVVADVCVCAGSCERKKIDTPMQTATTIATCGNRQCGLLAQTHLREVAKLLGVVSVYHCARCQRDGGTITRTVMMAPMRHRPALAEACGIPFTPRVGVVELHAAESKRRAANRKALQRD